jgi:hypothetical protein
MIITLVAVGYGYSDKINEVLHKLSNYKVCLLTDVIIDDVFYCEKYLNNTFSYFDKFYFSLQMVEKFKDDVFYIDINKIDEVDFNFNKDTQFYFKSHWPYGDYFEDYFKYTNYFNPFIDYCNSVGIDYKRLPVIRETELFFGKDINTNSMLHLLREIQPIFRKMCSEQTKYKGLDNGEGLALSYALKRCDIL